MSVCLFTFHAYRSWTEDNKRGYVQRGKPGVQPPNTRLAAYRASIARSPPVQFSHSQKLLLIESALEISEDLELGLHAVSVTPTHMHLLISWTDQNMSSDDVSALLKRKLGNRLSRRKGSTGNRWFSRGDDQRHVKDRDHFDYLCEKYLPDHVHQDGCFWRQGLAAPISARR